jgi:murein DD-endopeptidase MepM/ murein hydrolase activator NlpD
MPFAGKVERTNWSRHANGNCVEVVYTDGKIGRFLHLDKLDASVVPGVELAAGAPVGTSGNTGHSIAPHLHYEVRTPAGDVLDPLQVHGTTVVTVPEGRLAEFHTVRELFERLLDERTLAVAPKL